MFLPDWKDILRTAWSVRLMALAAILSGVEVGLAFYVPDWPASILGPVSGIITAAACVARLLAQSKPEGKS